MKTVFPNYTQHADELKKRFAQISAQHVRRRQEAGVDPRLVMVIELNAQVDPDEFARAGIRVLDDSDGRTVIAFADDPQLAEFLRRVSEYEGGPAPERKNPRHQGLMDAINDGREYAGADKLSRRLRERCASANPDDLLRLDIECWHPGDPAAAEEWRNEVRTRIVNLGGTVVDTYLSNNSFLSLLRVRLLRRDVELIAEMSSVARLDLLPEPLIAAQDVYGAGAEQLPTVPAPADDAPLVGVIDSGVRSAHPLLAPALRPAVTLSASIADGQDRDGHGTAVTSLVLHGQLEELIARGGAAPAPPCWVLSVRVLDDQALFPENELWERSLARAVEYCADQGARIINLSLGSALTPYVGAKATPVAAVLDEIARRRGLVLVISTGNVRPVDYIANPDADTPQTYVDALSASEDTRMIDPAPAALALTVGAVCHDPTIGALHREVVEQRPLGTAHWPSPYTRRGPGIRNSIKPEVVAPGGTLAYDDAAHGYARVDELKLVVASARPDRLLALDAGTSLAGPQVTHVVAGVAERHANASSNLLRALALQSAVDTGFWRELHHGTENELRARARLLQGYGRLRLEEARGSTNHRVVMYGTANIRPDDVQLWEIPVPRSFLQRPGDRELVVALAFDPPTRGRRLDYLASTMHFDVLRGITAEAADRVYAAATEEELEEVAQAADTEEVGTGQPTTLGQLKRRRLPLQPNADIRRRGANQFARWSFRQRLRQEDGDTYLLVVRNVSSWATEDQLQEYAIALAWVEDPESDPIYAELEARLEARVEVELEARV